VAERIRARTPGSTEGTTGRLDRHDGGIGLPLESGSRTGLVDALERRLGTLPEGFTKKNRTHVEAHAAAYLHLNPQIRSATLYINNEPCPRANGCRERLADMIPPGRSVTIYGPNEFWRVYHGQRSNEREP
jgi:hypothetical protein